MKKRGKCVGKPQLVSNSCSFLPETKVYLPYLNFFIKKNVNKIEKIVKKGRLMSKKLTSQLIIHI